jgi:nitroreductase
VSASPLLELIASRRSVRRFLERPVSEDIVRALVEAARAAPSADNAQPWRFVAIQDPHALAELARASFSGIFFPTRFAAHAPLLIALCAERATLLEAGKSIKDRAMYQLDCGIAGTHLVLRAGELGLGTCWIGWFDRRKARKSLGIPFHVQVVALIAVGYPQAAGPARPKVRQPLASMLWQDRWGRAYPGTETQDGSRK